MTPTLERLFRLSPRALSDDELLELLLDTAALAREDLPTLARTPAEDWLDDPRLTAQQSARLLSALELGRRSVLPRLSATPRLRRPIDTFELIGPQLKNLAHEELHVLCLGPTNLLLRQRCVAKGSSTHCFVDPREVFAPAVLTRAAAVLLVHNHPSGDPQPSSHDVALTRQLQRAAKSLCIRLVDHLVVGDDAFVSMLEAGLLEPAETSAPAAMEP